MRKHLIAVAVTVAGLLFGALAAAAQGSPGAGQSSDTSNPKHWYSPSRYNPARAFKKDSRTASEQLAANRDEDKKLTSQLQAHGVLPARTDLKDVCSAFRKVEDCVAALHASHNLKLKFNCVKWDMTGVKPGAGASSCAGPASDRAMSLAKTIRVLKPDASANAEEKTARKQAHDDMADAKS
ncbi:MAG: hypothetical protein AUI53_06715 [Acidobacteria bacterium 13_1_40CM_2_60_7]|nr:MAG: hypothetical protein AUI53_06715 [Acidobacteria bacterium 13_1_40CM_2_60_7]